MIIKVNEPFHTRLLNLKKRPVTSRLDNTNDIYEESLFICRAALDMLTRYEIIISDGGGSE